MTIADLKEAIERYAEATRLFVESAESLSADQLDRMPADGWSPRQVIHHVADSEAQSYARLRRTDSILPLTGERLSDR